MHGPDTQCRYTNLIQTYPFKNLNIMNEWHPIFQYFMDFVAIFGILTVVAIVLIPALDGTEEAFQGIAIILFIITYAMGVRRGKSLKNDKNK